jgi:hypothetical protein
MPTDAYRQHLETRLQEIDGKMARAKTAVEAGDPKEKAGKIEEWSQLKRQHEDLVQRIAAAQKEGSEAWSVMHTSFREEADALADTLEKWLTRVSR